MIVSSTQHIMNNLKENGGYDMHKKSIFNIALIWISHFDIDSKNYSIECNNLNICNVKIYIMLLRIQKIAKILYYYKSYSTVIEIKVQRNGLKLSLKSLCEKETCNDMLLMCL